MKNLLFIFSVLLLVHCSKKQKNIVTESEYIPLKYDTVPVDSFTYKKSSAISDSLKKKVSKDSIKR